MTNVPNNIRQMWTDVYVLFDLHYLIPNTEEAWNAFWADAVKLHEKYGKQNIVVSMIMVATEIIENRMREEADKDGHQEKLPV